MIPWSSIASAYIVGSRTGRTSHTSSNGFGLVLALLSLGLVMAAVGLHNAHWPYVSTFTTVQTILFVVAIVNVMIGVVIATAL